MQKYNAILVIDEKPGLHLITPEAYVAMVSENTGIRMENWGDFYSNHSPDRLVDIVFEELREDDDMLVDEADFRMDDHDKSVDYIVRRESGVWIYCPQNHEDGIDVEDAEIEYGLMFASIYEDVVSEPGTCEHFTLTEVFVEALKQAFTKKSKEK